MISIIAAVIYLYFVEKEASTVIFFTHFASVINPVINTELCSASFSREIRKISKGHGT